MRDYLQFFGFKDYPFRLTPDTKYFYPSYTHESAYKVLFYGIERGEGFFVLQGLPGTGKTLLLRYLLNEIYDIYENAFIISPNLSFEELLMAILDDLDIAYEKLSKVHLIQRLYNYLLDLAAKNKKLLLVIDEAQNLSCDVLEDLRLLSNLETEKEKLLQIVLAGQPSLGEKLRSPEMSQLFQRVSVWHNISTLSLNEVKKYVYYRLALAGNSNIRISDNAFYLIRYLSKGIPRLINRIMDRILLVAASRKTYFVNISVVFDILDEFLIDPSAFKKMRFLITSYLTR